MMGHIIAMNNKGILIHSVSEQQQQQTQQPLLLLT